MAVQTALLTPTVALSLYVVATIVKCPMGEATREVWKFVIAVTGHHRRHRAVAGHAHGDPAAVRVLNRR
jgi:hypothetical protein